LKQYEKSALIRFFLLLFGAFMLMFLLIAVLYYFQEYTQLTKELALNAQLEYIECMKLELGDCDVPKAALQPDMRGIYHNIFTVLGLLLLLVIPITLWLSFFSVKPVRKASTMIDNFIANIVHDINTPISTIMLNSRSLIKHTTTPSAKHDRILASAKQLQDMQHDLLALADEKIELERHEVALKILCEEIIEDFRLKYPKQPFNVTLNEQTAYVNQVDMRRIIQNLISNAVKYNRNSNPIKLYNGAERLVIEDQGKGMKHPEKIFDKNYREDYTIQGNGIGLASVLAMLTRNHIEITVSSQLHQGTIIQLDFNDTDIKDHI
jgi:two-component system OmpR family sensor kinase